MDKLTRVANNIKINLASNDKLAKTVRKIAQFLEENPYSVEVASMVEEFLQKNKQLLLLNSGLSGLETYINPADVRITVASKGSGFQVNIMLPELKISNSESLTNMLSKNVYGLLENSKDFADYNFTVIVSS